MSDQLVPVPDALTKGRLRPDIVEIPARLALTVDGRGAPDEPGFAAAVSLLFTASYAIRGARKRAGRPTFKVGPLEGEWRGEAPARGGPGRRGAWQWQLRIGMPSDVTVEDLNAAITAAGPGSLGTSQGGRAGGQVQLTRLGPVRCARVLHVGSYSTEPESFAKLDEMLASHGLRRAASHVEVYLSDPRRVPPERLKTVLLSAVT